MTTAKVPAPGSQTRPPLAQPAGGERDRSINGLLSNPKTIAKFQQIVPKHLNPERMLRVMAHAVYKVPKLGECEPVTLLGSMMACASLGLEPNTPLGHAYLIPFEKTRWDASQKQRIVERVDVNLIIGYRGYIDLARRSGNLVSIHADVVYGAANGLSADDFDFEYGSNMHLRHVPIGDNAGRPPIWAYAHASLKDGQAFEVLPYERVLRIRDQTQAYQTALRAKVAAEKNPARDGWKIKTFESTPWVAYEPEMAAKTMIRRLSTKSLPLSIEFANAVQLDAMSDTGTVDYSAFADGVDMRVVDVSTAAVTYRQEVGDLGGGEHIDEETGEVLGEDGGAKPTSVDDDDRLFGNT